MNITKICVNTIMQSFTDKFPKFLRIISLGGGSAYYVDIDGEGSMPLTTSIDEIEYNLQVGLLKTAEDPYHGFFDRGEASENDKKKMDSNWEVVDYIWNTKGEEFLSKSKRAACIREAAVKMGFKESTVRKLIRRFLQRGMKRNAMLPDYKKTGGNNETTDSTKNKGGRPKKTGYAGEVAFARNVTEEDIKNIKAAIKDFYLTRKQRSKKATYYMMLERDYSDFCPETGVKVWDESRVPSYRTFLYYCKKFIDPETEVKMRKGSRYARSNHREITKKSARQPYSPGSFYQIDATILPVYLISSISKVFSVIKKPVYYAVIDVVSRMIVGIYVGVGSPSWEGAMMALANVVENKVDFCARYGINIKEEDWSCQYLPEAIIADNGEFASFKPDNLIDNLGVKIQNTPTWHPDMKGIVENHFRWLKEFLRQNLPGTTTKKFRERGERDCRIDARLTLESLTRILINYALYHNSKIIDKYDLSYDEGLLADNVPPIPKELWDWGIKNRRGSFTHRDLEIVKMNLLPKGTAQIQKDGIYFDGRYYSCKEASKEGWYVRREGEKVRVVYDPRNIGQIYIPDDKGTSFITCSLPDNSAYQNKHEMEYDFQQEIKQLREVALRKKQTQNAVTLYHCLVEEVKNANEENRLKPRKSSKTKTVKDIKENTKIEREHRKKNEAFKPKGKKNEVLNTSDSTEESLLDDIGTLFMKDFDKELGENA